MTPVTFEKRFIGIQTTQISDDVEQESCSFTTHNSKPVREYFHTEILIRQ